MSTVTWLYYDPAGEGTSSIPAVVKLTLAEARDMAMDAHRQTEDRLAADRAEKAQRSGTIPVTLEYAGRSTPLPIEDPYD